MSHTIVKSIGIKGDKVYLTSADSSIRPLYYHRWECTSLSKILSEKGKDALYATIGEEVWNGNMHLRHGSKLCALFMEARNAFPRDMNFSTFDSKAAGTLLGEMVTKLAEDPKADLLPYIQRALEMRNDRGYILEAAQRTGHNFLNYASEEVQRDRAFALQVLHTAGGTAWFSYPAHFKDDKEFALEALQLNGCLYRELSDRLKADREVLLAAFQETPGKKYHEHLPDLIPPEAYCFFNASSNQLEMDKAFVCKLVEICPAMHMDRAPHLLADRAIALKWAQVGKFFPFSFSELPKQYQHDKEFQDTLIRRFENTDKYDTLLQRFAREGLIYSDNSFDAKLSAAKARAAVARQVEQKPKESEPER